jgi:hypothetical protein
MSMYLKRYDPRKEFWHSCGTWEALFNLACEYGWEPEGTEWGGWYDPDDPHDEERQSELAQLWEGSYFYNMGQFVTESDAKTLCSSLKRAKEELESKREKALSVVNSSGPFLLTLDLLKEFLEFCDGKEFAIH